jgi:hypothetical protein
VNGTIGFIKAGGLGFDPYLAHADLSKQELATKVREVLKGKVMRSGS